MTIWQNQIDNSLHDDMNGEALNLPIWPQGMIQLTDSEVEAIQSVSNTAQLAIIASQPNPIGFISDCKTAVGGITAIATNASLAIWSLTFNATVLASDWSDVAILIEAANANGSITPIQYQAIQAANIANNIGLVLP